MRNVFVLFIILSATTSLCAQTETNLFAKHGLKKVIMSTSSKGEFEEFHYNKEVVEIGSILYNTKTKEVIGYIDESIENDVTSATPAMSIDPNCEKYYWISPYAYCLNNPVRYVDPDGRDIVLMNVYKTNDISGGYKARTGSVSTTTQSALVDFMKTKEGQGFFGQFAKAGDIVGGYKFEKDGIYKDKTLTLRDYSFEEGYNSHLPLSIEGSINIKESEVTVKVFSFGENKANVGEILTHETQLHGYQVSDKMNGKSTTSTMQDHNALKSQDKTHKGYQKYDLTRKHLETIDPAYTKSFNDAEEHAKRMY